MTLLVAHRPSPALAADVARVTGFESPSAEPRWSREYPVLAVPVIVDLGTGWTVEDPREPDAAPVRLGSFVAGLWDGPVDVANVGPARCVQVDLVPQAARRLFGVPLSELANRSVGLDDLWREEGRRIEDRLHGARTWDERFAIVDAALRRRLAAAPAPDPGVAWAMARIRGSGGRQRIGPLASDLGWSHRRLIARFRDQVGLPPKAVARIARVERVLARIGAGDVGDWGRTAAEMGYADQSHLAREVRALTGSTPGGLRAEGVNFLQDGGRPVA